MTLGFINGIYSSLTRTDFTTANQSLAEQLHSKARLVKSFIDSYRWARQKTEWFHDIRHYCLFVGHARSGSSLTGALLDAHPNAIIGDEADVLQYLDVGFTKEQIFHLLVKRSHRHANKGHVKAGRDGKQYSYQVPGAWQGRHEQLLVIGNRKAGITTQRLSNDGHALQRLQAMLGKIRLKLIMTVRNPYDTISTMSIRSGRGLESWVTQYFANCSTIQGLQNSMAPENLLMLRHEDLLRDPDTHLQQMCRFLDLPAPESYLRACSAILFQSPAASRKKVKWEPEMIQNVGREIEKFPFLEGYAYES
jgi:hypothetical protein